jgi:hypothetical protein
LFPPFDPLRTGAIALPSLLQCPTYHQFVFSDFGQKGDIFRPDHVNQNRSQFNALELNRDGLLDPADSQRVYLTGVFVIFSTAVGRWVQVVCRFHDDLGEHWHQMGEYNHF